MEGAEFLVAALLVSVAALNAVASRIGIPYPIVLVSAASALGALPGLPEIELDPDLVLLVFLPPLLYSRPSSPTSARCAATPAPCR